MEIQKKHVVPDTLWIGFGRKDAPIISEPNRFKDYFYAWMHPHKYKIKDMAFWPGYSWGTVKLESREARDALLEHVLRKPFRPDNETGWVMNKFEKVAPISSHLADSSSPKKSPIKAPKAGINIFHKKSKLFRNQLKKIETFPNFKKKL